MWSQSHTHTRTLAHACTYSRAHIHTHTVGRTPLDEWSARPGHLYLTTHNTHNRETSIPSSEFEPAIPAVKLPHTHALDRAATGMGDCVLSNPHRYTEKLTSSVENFFFPEWRKQGSSVRSVSYVGDSSITALWDVTPCSLVDICWYFKGKCCLHWNVGIIPIIQNGATSQTTVFPKWTH